MGWWRHFAPWVSSICPLGELYLTGRGVEKDLAKGAELCKKAADHGHVPSQTLVGRLYATGQGLEKNPELAARYMTKAANGGDSNAQASLAEMYWKGLGVEKNQTIALKLLQSAGNRGHGLAQFQLGQYFIQEGKTDDPKRFKVKEAANAYYWLSLAIRHLPDVKVKEKAELLREKLQSALPEQARQAVEDKLEAWKPSTGAPAQSKG